MWLITISSDSLNNCLNETGRQNFSHVNPNTGK